MTDVPVTDVPAKRLTVEQHLQRAAAAPLDSYAERYHLDAATAEALLRAAKAIEKLPAYCRGQGVELEREIERLRPLLAEGVRLMEQVDPGYLPEADQEKAQDWWGDATAVLAAARPAPGTEHEGGGL